MKAPHQRVRLAITLGDPRGIGPEIVESVLRRSDLRQMSEYQLVGATLAGIQPQHSVGHWPPAAGVDDKREAGRLSGLAIERAVALAKDGIVDGIVTAPIDKSALQEAGYAYPGHTEMLGHLTGCETVMMLASERLRVVLATTHIALRDVATALTQQVIVRTAEITRQALRTMFDIDEPRIALCALNPHAGEGGRFGSEELTVLGPAAAQAGLLGPFPADTVFVRAMKGEFDVVIAPYHDVGMTAIKVASFGSAVNVTLGLPFPRCSPDHGTALDIAGRGLADDSSMAAAVKMCAALAARRRGQS